MRSGTSFLQHHWTNKDAGNTGQEMNLMFFTIGGINFSETINYLISEIPPIWRPAGVQFFPTVSFFPPVGENQPDAPPIN